jgi:hypothetical protein
MGCWFRKKCQSRVSPVSVPAIVEFLKVLVPGLTPIWVKEFISSHNGRRICGSKFLPDAIRLAFLSATNSSPDLPVE